MKLQEKLAGVMFTTLHDQTDEQIGTVAHTCSYEDLENDWQYHLQLMEEKKTKPCLSVFQQYCKENNIDVEIVSIHLY